MTIKQAKAIKYIIRDGFTKEQALIKAGYSRKTAETYGTQLFKKDEAKRALARAGLDENSLALLLKTNIVSGVGVKATADTSIRGISLAYQLRGDLLPEKEQIGDTTNIYIKELKTLPDSELQARLKAIEGEISEDK